METQRKGGEGRSAGDGGRGKVGKGASANCNPASAEGRRHQPLPVTRPSA